jgi:D-beta-D-heptose 7-phosphate kinase/D-beta-D-heptose 1-phosphate adenosyltransferase
MLRLDTEETEGYPAQSCRALSETIASAITSVNAVVLSDYAKGVLSEDVARLAIREARARDIPVLVDPKRRSFERYYGATIICPNLAELGVAAGTDGQNLDAVLTAGQQLCSQLSLDCIAVTLSEKGIAVLRPGSRFVAPAVARQVFDVSGAGDTVIATLAMAMANQVDIETAVQIANIAAGIVVSKVGTVPVTRDELLVQLMPDIELRAEEKVLSLEQLKVRASAWRSAGQAIAFTNGCFDLLHLGHITLLEEARRQGDRLIVAINSDSSVRQLKGPSRPIVCERDRARILAALAAVDAVVVFQEATPLRLIEELRPDIIVKGGDYREESIVGAREVRSWGGRIKIVPTVEGFSTTSLIARFTAPAN